MSAATWNEDRAEITDLFALLADVLDEGRHEEAGTVYTTDVTVHSPRAELRGVDAVIDLLRRSEVAGERTQHVHGDILVRADGDGARATANQLVYFYRDGAAPHRISGLRVASTAVRTPVGWRFSETRITLNWQRED